VLGLGVEAFFGVGLGVEMWVVMDRGDQEVITELRVND